MGNSKDLSNIISLDCEIDALVNELFGLLENEKKIVKVDKTN